MEAILRQITMLSLIPGHPAKVSTSSLVEKLEGRGFPVSQRTVQRDLNQLSRFFQLVSDDHRPAGWSWSVEAEAFSIPAMDPMAAIVFKLTDQYLGSLMPTAAVALLKPYLANADRILEETGRGRSRLWLEKVRFVPRMQPLLPPHVDPQIMRTVYEALLVEKRLEIMYCSRGQKKSHPMNVAPLGIIVEDQVTKVVVGAAGYKDILTLALHRFTSAVLTEQTFEKPEGFDLQGFLDAGRLGFLLGKEPIRLKAIFSEEAVLHLFETPLSEDQRIQEMPDAKYLLEATLPDTSRLRFWLKGIGSGVEVLEPARLRKEMVQTVEEMTGIYGVETAW